MKDFLYSFKAKPTRATIFTMLSLLALGTYSSFAQEEAGPTVADAIFTANNMPHYIILVGGRGDLMLLSLQSSKEKMLSCLHPWQMKEKYF